MRRRDVFIDDEFDTNVSRLFNQWVLAFSPPKNGRALLFEQIMQKTSNPYIGWNIALVIIRWFFRNLILKPIDGIFQPVLYFSDVYAYPAHVIHRDSSIIHLLIC